MIVAIARGASVLEGDGVALGIGHDCAVSCDNIVTVPASTLGRLIGYLLPQQEAELAEAIRTAFDLI